MYLQIPNICLNGLITKLYKRVVILQSVTYSFAIRTSEVNYVYLSSFGLLFETIRYSEHIYQLKYLRRNSRQGILIVHDRIFSLPLKHEYLQSTH